MVEAQEQLARVQADRAYIDNYQPQMQPQTQGEQQASRIGGTAIATTAS